MMWVLAGFTGLLIAIHMAQPRFKRQKLSAARFFADLPRAVQGRKTLRPGNPLKSRPLYPQLLILLLLLAALYSIQELRAAAPTTGVGLWILVDTSASMSTRQDGMTRMELARQEAGRLVSQAQARSQDHPFCARLTAFDMELREFVPAAQDALLIQGNLERMEHRPLGTDLSLLQNAIRQMSLQTNAQCPITHVLVITDLHAPEWVMNEATRTVIWVDVAKPVDNLGILSVQAARDPLTGLVRKVKLELVTYGLPPSNPKVEVSDPSGKLVLDHNLEWGSGNVWLGEFAVATAGLYHVQITPGDAYAYDDQVTISVDTAQLIHVDWQLADRSLFEQLGWIQDTDRPQLRVLPLGSTINDLPTLLVGNLYDLPAGPKIQIRYFYEGSVLLNDLNFDVLESLGLSGLSIPNGFTPVLQSQDEQIWLAQRSTPPAAIVPGLPTFTEDNLGKVSITIFFNAVRWLLQEKPLEPLYTLTSPAQPDPGVNRFALHPNEGNTGLPSVSYGDVNAIEPTPVIGQSDPVWPSFLALAALLFALERTLFIFGGQKWR